MAEQPTAETVIEALRNRGDARDTGRWPEGDPDYIAEYSLTSKHIPALISLATQWVDAPPENVAVYGPVHAWRALGQMRAVEAVQPLLDLLLDLKSVESAEAIESAFDATVIDPSVASDWSDVRRELGVPGLGMAPDHSVGWPSIGEQLGTADSFAEQQRAARQRKKEHDAERRAKAKRNQQKKDRRHSKRPR
jgi:hypothetical protein